MKDVGMATSAAPIYFPSYSVDNLNLVDGGPALLITPLFWLTCKASWSYHLQLRYFYLIHWNG